MSAGPIVLSHPLAKRAAPVLDDVRSASVEFASRARRGGLSPACDRMGALHGGTRCGAVTIPPRSSELRRGSKLWALDRIRSELSCVLIRCALEAQQILSTNL